MMPTPPTTQGAVPAIPAWRTAAFPPRALARACRTSSQHSGFRLASYMDPTKRANDSFLDGAAGDAIMSQHSTPRRAPFSWHPTAAAGTVAGVVGGDERRWYGDDASRTVGHRRYRHRTSIHRQQKPRLRLLAIEAGASP